MIDVLDSLYLSIHEWCQKQQGIQLIYGQLLEVKRLSFLVVVEDINDYTTANFASDLDVYQVCKATKTPQLSISLLHQNKGYATLCFVQDDVEVEKEWVLLADYRTSNRVGQYENWLMNYNQLNGLKKELTQEEVNEFYLNLYHLRMLEDCQFFYRFKELEDDLVAPFLIRLNLMADEKKEFISARQDYDPKRSHVRLIQYLTIFEHHYPTRYVNHVVEVCRMFITR